MQLNQYQRRAMLFCTDNALYHGDSIAIGPRKEWDGTVPTKYRFLGDILSKDRRWLEKCRNVGRMTIEHVICVMCELIRLPLGTELDERTAKAFEEAKAAVMNDKRPEDAWPKWYIQGRNQPKK